MADPLDVATRHLAGRDAAAWLVGGRLRDALLGRGAASIGSEAGSEARRAADADVVVAHGALDAARAIARSTGGAFVLLDARRGYGRVVWPGDDAVLDITDLAGGSIEADLAARDFTVNALAVPLGTSLPPPAQAVVDPLGGLRDVAAGTVRVCAPSALEADPLRLWRGPRLAATHGLALEPGTRRAIAERAHLAGRPAGERIREEVLRLLAAPEPGRAAAELDALGLLASALPDLARAASRPADAGAGRTWRALDALAAWQAAWFGASFDRSFGAGIDRAMGADAGSEGEGAAAPPAVLRPFAADLEAYGRAPIEGQHPTAVMDRLALLVAARARPGPGGPPTRAGGRSVGAASRRVAAALRLSGAAALHLERAARLPGWLPRLSRRGAVRRDLYRYFRCGRGGGVGAVLVALALDAARRPAAPAPAAPRAAEPSDAVAAALLDAWYRRRAAIVDPVPLVDGAALMSALGIPAGPLVGRLLAALREAQAAGELASPREALALAARLAARADG